MAGPNNYLKPVPNVPVAIVPKYIDYNAEGKFGPEYRIKDQHNNVLTISAKWSDKLVKCGAVSGTPHTDLHGIPGKAIVYTRGGERMAPTISSRDVDATGAVSDDTTPLTEQLMGAVNAPYPVKLGVGPGSWEDLERVMAESWKAAARIVPEPTPKVKAEELFDAISRTALSLFIEARKRGIMPPPDKLEQFEKLPEELAAPGDDLPF